MPGRDGTGPDGMGPCGRRHGPCRDAEKKDALGRRTPSTAYGVGRGGKPRGCCMGRLGGIR